MVSRRSQQDTFIQPGLFVLKKVVAAVTGEEVPVPALFITASRFAES
jgi:hypothetical protein